MEITPTQKKIAICISIAIALFCLYWFVIKPKMDKKKTDPEKEKKLAAIKKELADCQEKNKGVRSTGDPCKEISDRLKKAEESGYTKRRCKCGNGNWGEGCCASKGSDD